MTDQPTVQPLHSLVRRWADQTPSKIALVDGMRSVTYAQLDSVSNQIANVLLAGSAAGSTRIGYLGKNSATLFEFWLGANKAGGALVPFNWRSSHQELASLIDDAKPELLIVGPEFVDLAKQALQTSTVAPQVVEEYDVACWLGDAPTDRPTFEVCGDDVALLTYTSGTTGTPKGVGITNTALYRWFADSEGDSATSWQATDVGLTVMPNFHLAGTWVSIPALAHGATLVVLPAFDPDQFIEAVRIHRVTLTCLVPTAIQTLLTHQLPQRSAFSSLRRLMYAGSPINESTLDRVIDVFDCDLVQFYGTTETFIITLLRPDQHRSGDGNVLRSCGQPMPSVMVRLIGPDGADAATGDTGEVLVRSPWMFNGYWLNPTATAAALIDGWYHTGDVGRLDESGNLYLVDRLKDMIVTGGENVYSAEVERALQSHPAVNDAAVVGVPDETWGERVVAFVVPHNGAGLDIDELVAHCRGAIAGYKVPKQIHLTDSLPLTASGKVRKDKLRTKLIEQSE